MHSVSTRNFLTRLGLAQLPPQLPLKVEQEPHCDGDHRGSESNRCHGIIQSLNAHRIVILRVIIERMFWTVFENVGLFFDILLTPEKREAKPALSSL